MYNYSPLGKYSYKYLPTGVANSPENFRQIMNDFLQGFEFIHAHIDGILISTKRDWIDHEQKLELNLNKLQEGGLKFNIENYFFRQTEMKYLGFWLTCYGIKPIDKNRSNKNMIQSTFRKEGRQFIV